MHLKPRSNAKSVSELRAATGGLVNQFGKPVGQTKLLKRNTFCAIRLLADPSESAHGNSMGHFLSIDCFQKRTV